MLRRPRMTSSNCTKGPLEIAGAVIAGREPSAQRRPTSGAFPSSRRGLWGRAAPPTHAMERLEVLSRIREGRLAGELGLEPRTTVPKTAVLPLHHSPAGTAAAAPRAGGGIAEPPARRN